MGELEFGPLITAVITPFDENNQVNIPQLERLLDHLLDQKNSSVLVTSLVGEGQTLNSVEKLRVWESTIDFIGDQIPVIADVGTNNTKTTLYNVRLAEEADIDALLVVVPYYSKSTQQGLLSHFIEVANSTTLPILLHNDPKRCGIGLELATILELAQMENIVGVVDSSGTLDLTRGLKKKVSEDFLIYSGCDHLYLGNLKLKGMGVVSAVGYFVGKSMKTVFDLYQAGDIDEAEILNHRLIPFYGLTLTHAEPATIKALLNQWEFPVGGVRLPLVDLDPNRATMLWENLAHLVD